MGFLDFLLGVRNLPVANVDKLFSISTAAVTMEDKIGAKPTGRSGICFKTFESKGFEEVKSDIIQILKSNEFGMRSRVVSDEYGYTWIVLEGRDLEDIVTGIHIVSQLLIDAGYEQYILCAVFEFSRKNQIIYWIYNYKRGKFYPFIPREKEQSRDMRSEFGLKTLVSDEMPVDDVIEYWYPIWGVPF